MTVITTRSKDGIGLRLVGLSVVFMTVLSLMACIAAIPVAVHYYKTRDAYVATVTMNAEADKVYSEVLSQAEKRAEEGKVKILNKEKENQYIEVTDGVQTAGIKVNKVKEKVTNMVITANIPTAEGVSEELEKQKEKELAARIMTNLCQALSLNCELVEQ
jgi:hypothetical protein